MKLFLIICFLFFLCPIYSYAQVTDTLGIIKPFVDSFKQAVPKQSFFYILASLLFFLGLIRTIFSRYFSTLFRVFFNNSLRQNQLTDQLEQATLPSLLFNLFFVFSAGLYIYFVQQHFSEKHNTINWNFLGICLTAVAVCYVVKYFSLLFIGWLTNHLAEAKIYIFIVFLFNKIIGTFLLPFILLMAFSSVKIAEYAIFTSLISLSLLLLTRFFRTYSLLQNKLKLNFFHFFIYILALEILPIVLIYKLVVKYLANIT